jgi:hypothetical protein
MGSIRKYPFGRRALRQCLLALLIAGIQAISLNNGTTTITILAFRFQLRGTEIDKIKNKFFSLPFTIKSIISPSLISSTMGRACPTNVLRPLPYSSDCQASFLQRWLIVNC